MTVIFASEPFASFADELPPLFAAHHAEAGHIVFGDPDVDLIRYIESDSIGALCCVTARKDGKLVGYFVAYIAAHPHYKAKKAAFVDMIFLLPEHRRYRAGTQFIAAAEDFLRGLGVEGVYMGSKLRNPIDSVLQSRGYSPVEVVFYKGLV